MYYSTRKALASLSFLALAGCAPGNMDAYDGLSLNCSAKFVSDFNQVETTLSEALVDDFERKYKDVSCNAQAASSLRLDPASEKVVVNNQIGSWRKILKDRKSQMTVSMSYISLSSTAKASTNDFWKCTSRFIFEFNKEMRMLNLFLAVPSSSSLKSARSKVESLMEEYAGVTCQDVVKSKTIAMTEPVKTDFFFVKLELRDILAKLDRAISLTDADATTQPPVRRLIQNPRSE